MAQEKSQYSYPFIDQHIRIPQSILDRVNEENQEEYEGVRLCVGTVLLNLLLQGEVAYSRDSNHFTGKGPKHYTRTNLWKAVDIAVSQKYATKGLKGYWNPKYASGLSSTLRPGPRLSELKAAEKVDLEIGWLPLLVVDKKQVFDRDDLERIVNRPESISPGSRELLPRLHSVYSEAIRLNREYWNRMELDTSGLSPGLLCTRHVGMARGFKEGGVGRWHQMGELSYQMLPRVERLKLLINGEGVCELDYPAMHPHILYAWAGRRCPKNLYEGIMDICGCTRTAAKLVTLMAMNAGSYRALSSAVNLGKRDDPGENLYDELQESGLNLREVVQALVQAHPTLERYVFSGLANRLMLAESDIMTSVLLSLMEKSIPALPVHDSVVAPLRHKATVRQVMEEEYRQHTSFGITVV